MSEQLAIKTDDDWAKGKAKVIRTLTPRESDQGKKSAWAFYSSDDSDPSPAVIADPTLAPRILQALFLFFWSELHRKVGDSSRNSVRGVSIPREMLADSLVENDQQPHLLVGYDRLHRSLLIDDVTIVEQVAQKITETGAHNPWKYTRKDMARVLRFLLDRQFVAQALEADARSILAQWEANP